MNIEKNPLKLQLSDPTAKWLQSPLLESKHIDVELLTKACQFVEAISEKPTPFSNSAIEQGLAMADSLLELNCDSPTLAAAIAYPGFFYNQPSKEFSLKYLGPTMYKLIEGVQRMEAMHTIFRQARGSSEQQSLTDNLRKMLLAMVDDIRVVLIKLAERLTILKYLRHCNEIEQTQIAEQTMSIYAPLANRLGIGQLKWQLEDLAFRYINPEKYAENSKALNMRRKDREVFIQNMVEQLSKLLKNANIKKPEITGRAKHIYSIYRKMHRKGVDISEIYDTSAFRILVPTVQDCYTALSIVHAEWEPIEKEFDDYIAKPKPNGYQSIHTAVIGVNNVNVEIQIRTYEMHEAAELGVAAHWKYKEGTTTQSSYEEKIKWLREVMDWQQEVSTEETGADKLYSKIFEDRIYVFTPNGDVFDLTAGATPLDFAYHIHTDVGNRCKGAKVNDAIVPLTHALKTGDQIKILTAKQGNPSRDWMNPTSGYLKTAHARAKVRNWFKKQNYQSNLVSGHDLWDKASRRAGLAKNGIHLVVERFNFKKTDDLIAAIGAGDIGIATITQHIKSIQEKEKPAIEESIIKPTAAPRKRPKSELIIGGIDNLLTQLARCCKPIPGDHILGYVTTGRGVTIHQQCCRNIQHAIANKPERIMEVQWGEKTPQSFPVDLMIDVEDRAGLIRDISAIVASENIALLGMNTRANKSKNQAYVSLTIEINSLDSLTKIISQLRQITGVIRVERQ